MIGTLKIRVQAANPQMPLLPIFTFKGSPSSLRILDVPKSIGKWNITKVYIKSTSPDNSLKIHACVRQGSVWVGTIDGTEIAGKVKSGIEILADGIDENGSAVNGYVLGVGDYIVLERDSRITEKDIEKFYVKFVEQLPDNPNIGDTILDNGWLRIYDGQNWSEKPHIYVPTNVSEFQNDVPYATQNSLDSTNQIANEAMSVASGAKDSIVQINSYLYDVIPRQASSENQLADKDFVNSSIMTNTAYFKGTFNSVAELPTDRVTPNDYAFVVGKDSEGNTTYNRYKFTADGEWLFEWTLNNSSFTANQWATINSGITSASLDEYAKLAYVDAKVQNQPTMTLSGEYEDGTQFSFDAVIK